MAQRALHLVGAASWDALVRGAQAGVRADQERLLRALAPRVATVLRRTLGHDPDLDDLSQDALSELLCMLPRLHSAELGGLKVVRHSDGVYATVPVQALCGAEVRTLTLSYSLLFDVDAQHRGLVRLDGPGGGQWRSFSTDTRSLTLDLTPPPVGQQTWLAFHEGVHHITIGWDHLCFLFALLLPSVLRREKGRWLPRAGFKESLVEVTKVVTAFTVAHSITLGLSAFGVLAPSARWVEVAIAFSVVLAALNTVFPVLTEGRWALAFGLGLLHGFGFVSALADLGATGSRVWASVLGFNLGVEAGQLAIVACFVPLAFFVRERPFYGRVVVPVGAVAITATASVWTLERLGLL